MPERNRDLGRLVIYLIAVINIAIGLIMFYREPCIFRGKTYEDYDEKASNFIS